MGCGRVSAPIPHDNRMCRPVSHVSREDSLVPQSLCRTVWYHRRADRGTHCSGQSIASGRRTAAPFPFHSGDGTFRPVCFCAKCFVAAHLCSPTSSPTVSNRFGNCPFKSLRSPAPSNARNRPLRWGGVSFLPRRYQQRYKMRGHIGATAACAEAVLWGPLCFDRVPHEVGTAWRHSFAVWPTIPPPPLL